MDDVKNHADADNTKLEKIMEMQITPETQMKFLEVFKNSQLLMPVTFSSNIFENLENAKEGDVIKPQGQIGFDINYLTDKAGNKAVPLFTSSEMMEKAGIRSSVYGLYMSDLAFMLAQTDTCSAVAVNPFTEYGITMPVNAFLSLFEDLPDKES